MVLQAVGLFTRYAWVFLGTTVETSGKTKLIDFFIILHSARGHFTNNARGNARFASDDA